MSRNQHIVTKREREQRRKRKAAAKRAKKEARRVENAASGSETDGDSSANGAMAPTEPAAIVRPTTSANDT